MSDHQKPDLSKSELNRQIRVFISSTFRDMHEERNYLATHIFPQLRKLCEQRGVVWGEVDLRWGINDEQKAEGKVLPICLKEIERCRPYFIGILGERYGWVPDTIPQDLIDSESWLEEHFGKTGKSVTELEILHGVINNPKMAEHAFFYFRDPSYIESIPAEKRSDFTAEDAEGAEKLKSLKERIRKCNFPVRENYQHPKELGALVLKDLTDVINKDFPEGSQPDPLEREAYEHEMFARSRTITEVRHGEYSGVYIGRDEYFKRLDEHAKGDGQPLVILGESGAGKSALLANWALQYRQKHSMALQRQKTTPQSPPSQGGDEGEVKDFTKKDELLIMHFIGSTPYSTDWMAMLRRVMGEFKRRFDIQGDIPDKPDALRQAFANWLHMAAAKGRVILILDALNQLEDRDGAHDLVWLPPVMPENIRLILSTLPGRSLDELKGRKWDTLTVEPLMQDERGVFIEKYLAQYTKSLHPDHARRIASAGQTSNPLYLKALLEELRIFGIPEQLDNRINHYLEAKTISALYERIFTRYEEHYEGERKGLVRDSMTLIWAARRGLSEAELLKILGTDDKPLPQAMWSALYLATEQSLVNRSGLIGFFHDYFRQAIQNKYLTTEDQMYKAHVRLADYFKGQDLNIRKVDELPWQLAEAHKWQSLYNLLADVSFLERTWWINQFDVKAYWTQVEINSDLRMVNAYKHVLETPSEYSENQVHILSILLGDMGHNNEAFALTKYFIEHYKQENDLENLSTSLDYQANILYTWGRLGEAMALRKEKERISRKLGDFNGLAISLANQVLHLKDQGMLTEALNVNKEAKELFSYCGNTHMLASCLLNESNIYMILGDYRSANVCTDDSERIFRFCGDIDGLQKCMSNKAAICIYTKRLDYAMQFLKQQQELCCKIGAKDGIQLSLGNQAVILIDQNKPEEALHCLNEKVEICQEMGLKESLGHAFGNIAQIKEQGGHFYDALRFYEQAEDIYKELNHKDGLQKTIGNRASLCTKIGDYEKAFELINIQEGFCRELKTPTGLVYCLMNKALLCAESLGQVDKASDILQEAIQIVINHGLEGFNEKIKSIQNALDLITPKYRFVFEQKMDLFWQKALNALDIDDQEKAMNYFVEIEYIARKLRRIDIVDSCLVQQAQIMKDRGHLNEAIKKLQIVEQIRRVTGDIGKLLLNLTIQARLLTRIPRPSEAVKKAKEVLTLSKKYNYGVLESEIQRIIATNGKEPVFGMFGE